MRFEPVVSPDMSSSVYGRVIDRIVMLNAVSLPGAKSNVATCESEFHRISSEKECSKGRRYNRKSSCEAPTNTHPKLAMKREYGESSLTVRRAPLRQVTCRAFGVRLEACRYLRT